MNTQILKVTKGHFYVYFNLNLRSYGQLFVLVSTTDYNKLGSTVLQCTYTVPSESLKEIVSQQIL